MIMRKQTFFLSSAFPSFGYNGTPLRPQNVETSIRYSDSWEVYTNLLTKKQKSLLKSWKFHK